MLKQKAYTIDEILDYLKTQYDENYTFTPEDSIQKIMFESGKKEIIDSLKRKQKIDSKEL